jgi:predicted CopG family antitoxin
VVKVITIRDDVYSKLYKIKISRGESFSETLDYLADVERQSRSKGANVLLVAGSLRRDEVDMRMLDKIRRGY